MARKSSTRPGCGGKPHVPEDHLDTTQAQMSLLLAHWMFLRQMKG